MPSARTWRLGQRGRPWTSLMSPLSPVEVLGDVAGDRLAELLLRPRQLHAQRAHMALGEERAALEIFHVLFEPAQEDGVFLAAHGLRQNLGAGEEVGVQQL